MSGLRVAFGAPGQALVRFGFAAATAADVQIACGLLAGPAAAESWIASPAAPSGYAWVAVEVDEAQHAGGVEAASAAAYRELIARVRPSPHPYLLRIWNYFGAINAGDGDGERYRRFCVGRAAAVDARFNAPPPAATAIGTPQPGGAVQVIALCGAAPGIALENPRQTPAWQYPREYGPVSPGFSRGVLTGGGDGLRLLASGTASIAGHVTRHAGDSVAQAQETLLNLEALLEEGRRHGGRRFALSGAEAVRVYLRHPEDLEPVRQVMLAGLDPARVVFLHGDICRAALRVELEGVFAPD